MHDQASGEFRFTTFDTTRAEVRKLVGQGAAGRRHHRGVSVGRLGPRSVRRTRRALSGRQHRQRGLEVQAPQTQDRQGRRPASGATVPARPVADGDLAADHGAAVAVADRLPADVGGPARGGAESHPRPVRGPGLAGAAGAKAWTATGLAGIATQAKPLAECGADELWRGLLELALTEYRQVCELVAQAETRARRAGQAERRRDPAADGAGAGAAHGGDGGGVSARRRPASQTGKQVSAYSGLVPRQHQSGEMDRRGRITKRGPALLRKMLVECAWCMMRYNAWARGIYQRLTGGGQRRKKQAIVALARKILVRCWAMLRDKKPWRDPQAGPKQPLPPSKQRRQAEAQRRRQAKQSAALARPGRSDIRCRHWLLTPDS